MPSPMSSRHTGARPIVDAHPSQPAPPCPAPSLLELALVTPAGARHCRSSPLLVHPSRPSVPYMWRRRPGPLRGEGGHGGAHGGGGAVPWSLGKEVELGDD